MRNVVRLYIKRICYRAERSQCGGYGAILSHANVGREDEALLHLAVQSLAYLGGDIDAESGNPKLRGLDRSNRSGPPYVVAREVNKGISMSPSSDLIHKFTRSTNTWRLHVRV